MGWWGVDGSLTMVQLGTAIYLWLDLVLLETLLACYEFFGPFLPVFQLLLDGFSLQSLHHLLGPSALHLNADWHPRKGQ